MGELFAAFGIDWRLLIAQALNFALVLLALWYFLYKPVLALLAKRQALVAQGVADAEAAKERLAGADEEALKRVRAAEGEAGQIVEQARSVAVEEKERLIHEGEARAAAIAAEADARAAETAARSLRESEKEVARLALLAAEKILKQHHD